MSKLSAPTDFEDEIKESIKCDVVKKAILVIAMIMTKVRKIFLY